jgi:aldehyde dehydrogenase (NAD+)
LQILVACESLPTGRTSRECKDLDIAQIIKILYHFAGATAYEATLEYDPLGLVAVVGHYDSSLLSLVAKIAPALAVGNACLIIPHKLAPLSAFMFAEICAQSGVPAGVLNLIVSEQNENELVNWACADSRLGGLTFDGKLLVYSF